jgi:hypothetical protein
MSEEKRKEVQARERTTIDEARQQGIGTPEEGMEPTVPSYTDPGGVSDLGVDEPVVPKSRQVVSESKPSKKPNKEVNEVSSTESD